MKRCSWAQVSELDLAYHDSEWGVPSFDDRHLFEMLVLEGAQAGLSWTTVLNKREGYRKAYANFEPTKVARFTASKQQQLLRNPGIVRNRLKVRASVENAQAYLQIQREHGSFATFIWEFVDHVPVQNRWRSHAQVPATTPTSEKLSRALKKRGFRFVGPTICYAFMQATGLVNDHVVDCFRHPELSKSPSRFSPPSS
jgi:DNA-3-methyladenine glycosylase I